MALDITHMIHDVMLLESEVSHPVQLFTLLCYKLSDLTEGRACPVSSAVVSVGITCNRGCHNYTHICLSCVGVVGGEVGGGGQWLTKLNLFNIACSIN